MPWTERLPSGNYRAGYSLPNGESRYVKGTFRRKKAAKDAVIEAVGKVKGPWVVRPPGWDDDGGTVARHLMAVPVDRTAAE